MLRPMRFAPPVTNATCPFNACSAICAPFGLRRHLSTALAPLTTAFDHALDLAYNRSFSGGAMKLDLLAIAAHPDDVELTCGGTLIKAAQSGYKTGVLDLTRDATRSREDHELPGGLR